LKKLKNIRGGGGPRPLPAPIILRLCITHHQLPHKSIPDSTTVTSPKTETVTNPRRSTSICSTPESMSSGGTWRKYLGVPN